MTIHVRRCCFWLSIVIAAAISAFHGELFAASPGEKILELDLGQIVEGPAATAIADDNTIYVTAGKKLFSIASDGTLKWSLQVANGNLSTAPSTASDGTIYAGNLVAVNPDGTVKWRFDGGSPAISENGTIYVTWGSKLSAVSPNGELKWSLDLGNDTFGPPVVAFDGTIYLGTCGSQDGKYKFLAIDSAGAKKWENAISGQCCSSATVGPDGTVYVVPLQSSVYAFTSAGLNVWKATTAPSNLSLGEDGTIYSAADGVWALDSNGNPKWDYRTSYYAASPPCIGQNGIYFAPRTDTGNVLISLNLSGASNWQIRIDGEAGAPVMSSSGTLYLATGRGKVYGILTGDKPARSSWPMLGQNARHTSRVEPQPAVILQQPVGKEVAIGTHLTLRSAAFGIPSPDFQWFLNRAMIPGATNQNLGLINVSTNAAGTYSLTVSNSFGFAVSDPAVVTVIPNFTEPLQPVITKVSPNQGAIGSLVSITGLGFSTNASENVVTFGAVRGVVTEATPTLLRVLVPAGATYALIVVTSVDGLTGYAPSPFTPIFEGGGSIDVTSFATHLDFKADRIFGAGVVIGDFDNDGKPDIAVAGYIGTVSVFKNNSSNRRWDNDLLSLPVVFSANGEFTVPTNLRLTAGDLDGDGKLDLLLPHSGGFSIYHNVANQGAINSNSFFRIDVAARPLTSAVIADFDLDGRNDIAVGGFNSPVYIYCNPGPRKNLTTNSFELAFQIDTGGVRKLLVADIDGDGKPDLIGNDTDGVLFILRNESARGGVAAFGRPIKFSQWRGGVIEVGDFDGDNKPEILVVGFSNGISPATLKVLRNRSQPGNITENSFTNALDLSVGSSTREVGIADFDGDGRPDIAVVDAVVGGESGRVSIFKNLSPVGTLDSSSFQPEVPFAVGRTPNHLAVGDLDGDGKPDLIIPYYPADGDVLSIFKNTVTPFGTPYALINGTRLALGSFTVGKTAQVTLKTSFPSGAIFYTTDGSEPSSGSAVYLGPFTISSSVRLRVIAYSKDFGQSAIAEPIEIIIVPVYSLTANTAGGGSLTLNPPNGPYLSNSVVTLTAQAAPGWQFIGWSGDYVGTGAVVSVQMDRMKSVQARFGTQIARALTGVGNLLLSPSEGPYGYGSNVAISAIPGKGFYFRTWGNAAIGTSNPLQFRVREPNPIISALFTPLPANSYSLTLLSMATNGIQIVRTTSDAVDVLTVLAKGSGNITITPSGNLFSLDQPMSLKSIPMPGHHFLFWSGDATGNNLLLLLPIQDGNRFVTANFSGRGMLYLDAISRDFTAGFRIRVAGGEAEPFFLQSSTNLVNWTDLVATTNRTGLIEIDDPAANLMKRKFYRAVIR